MKNVTEMLYRMIERHPFGGLTSREMARALDLPINYVSSRLSKLSHREVVELDPKTHCWQIKIANARFYGSKPIDHSPDPTALKLEPGLDEKDLEWMRKARAQAEARQKRKADTGGRSK